ncbi:hypothetical protein [Streptomyces sp. NPDC002225]|uniref:hypothetical protein n=1 Tax=Streptomyces sp. NPDC002225 TaxID=3154413 RepID=UPI0033213F6E
MNKRRSRALVAAVTPMLAPGEQVVSTSLVNLSEVSVKKNIAMGIAAAVLSGGTMVAAAAPQPIYLATTGERLFLFVANPTFAKPDRHLATYLLADLKRTEVKRGLLKHSFVMIDESAQSALRIFFQRFGAGGLDVVAGQIPQAAA